MRFPLLCGVVVSVVLADSLVPLKKDRIAELNNLNQFTSPQSSTKRPRIENLELSAEVKRHIEPQVLLFPVSTGSSQTADKVATNKDIIVSGTFDTLMFPSIIHPPIPGIIRKTTTPRPWDTTTLPASTPRSIKDLPKAPKVASFKNALYKGKQLDEKILKGFRLDEKKEKSEGQVDVKIDNFVVTRGDRGRSI